MKKIILALVLVIGVVVGVLFYKGVLQMPKSQKADEFLTQAENIMPQSTELFFSTSSDGYPQRLIQYSIEYLGIYAPLILSAEHPIKIDANQIDVFFKSVQDLNLSYGLWSKDQDSLINHYIRMSITQEWGAQAVGGLIYATYKSPVSLLTFQTAIEAQAKNNGIELKVEPHKTGVIFTVQNMPEQPSLYLTDHEILISISAQDLKEALSRQETKQNTFASNSLYKKAFPSSTVDVDRGFVDLKNVSNDDDSLSIYEKYVKSFDYMKVVNAFNEKDKSFTCKFLVHSDKSKAGPIAEVLSNQKQSAVYDHSAVIQDAFFVFDTNLLSYKNLAEQILTHDPERKNSYDSALKMLQLMNIDMDKDILGTFDGQATLVMKKIDLKNQNVFSEDFKPQFYLALKLKDQNAFLELLKKTPLSTGVDAPVSKHNNSDIYSLTDQGVFFTFADKFIILADSEAQLKETLDDISKKTTLKSETLFSKLDYPKQSFSVLQFFMDAKSYAKLINDIFNSEEFKTQISQINSSFNTQNYNEIMKKYFEEFDALAMGIYGSAEGIGVDFVLNTATQ